MCKMAFEQETSVYYLSPEIMLSTLKMSTQCFQVLVLFFPTCPQPEIFCLFKPMCFPTSTSRSLVLHFFNIQTVLHDMNLGNYILQSCSGVKEMYQSVWCTCIVIDLLIWHIAFLKFLLSSRLWHFKLPNVLHGQAISMLHNLSLNHQCKGVLYCALLLLFMLLFLKSLNL